MDHSIGRDQTYQARTIVDLLRRELTKHMDVDKVVASFGQVAAATRRENGEILALRDHLRGMVLALLSANRPWKPIADRMEQLENVFGGYRPSFLESADPEQLERDVRSLQCGNRRISFQMRAIQPNLETFRRIDEQHATIDNYVGGTPIENVVRQLGEGRTNKLRELGPTLVLEYLKNVGVRASKPDVHLLRILGPKRLGILPEAATPLEAFAAFRRFAAAAEKHEVELDNLVWLLGAEEYAARCGARPQCSDCALQTMCNRDA